MKARITLFDTTLRDGAQTSGIDFSLSDKIVVANMLDEFGIDYVEGGGRRLTEARRKNFGNPILQTTDAKTS